MLSYSHCAAHAFHAQLTK